LEPFLLVFDNFRSFSDLRELWLTLDDKPLITDTAFRDVFGKMSLKELHLSAVEKLEKVRSSLLFLSTDLGRVDNQFDVVFFLDYFGWDFESPHG